MFVSGLQSLFSLFQNSLWPHCLPHGLFSVWNERCPSPSVCSTTSCARPVKERNTMWKSLETKNVVNIAVMEAHVCTCRALYSPSEKLRRGVRKWMSVLWTNFFSASPSCFWASPHLSRDIPADTACCWLSTHTHRFTCISHFLLLLITLLRQKCLLMWYKPYNLDEDLLIYWPYGAFGPISIPAWIISSPTNSWVRGRGGTLQSKCW